jgi:phosphoglycerol transferase MdoB-like AlkP superfamily enzyme
MQRLCLTIVRFSLSAWIGAASLFVVTSIAEQRSTAFGSDVKNILAALRFPSYYCFGFVLVGLGLICGTLGIDRRRQGRRWFAIVSCLVLALLLMLVDYVAVYSPLYAIVTDPSGVRDARFLQLHRWSEQINTADVTLCLVAAIAACWPEKPSQPPTPNP